MPDKMIPFCKLYENVSRTTGKRYLVGTLSFTSKLLIFPNEDAKDGEPQWSVFLTEREQKPQTSADGIPDPGEPARRRRTGTRSG